MPSRLGAPPHVREDAARSRTASHSPAPRRDMVWQSSEDAYAHAPAGGLPVDTTCCTYYIDMGAVRSALMRSSTHDEVRTDVRLQYVIAHAPPA